MSEAICSSCRGPKASFACDLCEEAICKSCRESFSPASLAMLSEIPEALRHSSYCRFCYDEKVAPVLARYEETLEKAKGVYIFFKTQRKEIPLLRRSREVLKVTDMEDRDETILKLAFMAAEQGFNAVTEVDVTSKKVKNGRHTKSVWTGTGKPAEVDAAKTDLQSARNEIYR
jgi:hypothetical protein